MAAVQAFSSETRVAAPIDVVWSVMTDHVRYARWGTAKKVTLVEIGRPERDGVGAVRKFHAGPLSTYERVVEFEPPHAGRARMVYVLDRGLPVRNYRAEMLLSEVPADAAAAAGDVDTRPTCVLRWSSTFEPVIPATGGLLRRVMASAVGRFAVGIRDDAESEAGTGAVRP